MGRRLDAGEVTRLLVRIGLKDEEIARHFGILVRDVAAWKRDGVDGAVTNELHRLAQQHTRRSFDAQRMRALHSLSAESSVTLEEASPRAPQASQAEHGSARVELCDDGTCVVFERGFTTRYDSVRHARSVWEEWASFAPGASEPLLEEERALRAIASDVVRALSALPESSSAVLGVGEMTSVASEAQVGERRVDTLELMAEQRRQRALRSKRHED